MRTFRSSRWLILALLAALLPMSSFAGVFISVGFAPPVLPVYEQPPCPEDGLMWMPGYWAYGPDGYYWVPGAWVPPPFDGALWTPPYWGWDNGLYIYHPGYWGLQVGYYGGVDYGFGYMGIGFVGGRWHGHEFDYNTAVMHVDRGRIHHIYDDRAIVARDTVARGSRVAFSGGPGGIQHQPTAEERAAEHVQHVEPTRFQQEHVQAAQTDKSLYARNNGGHPQHAFAAKPLQAESHAAPAPISPSNHGLNSTASHGNGGNRAAQQHQTPQQMHTEPQSRPVPQFRTSPQPRPTQQERPSPQFHPAPASHPAPQFRTSPQHAAPQPRAMAPQQRPAPEQRPAPQFHAAPQPRPAPQTHSMPAQHHEDKPDEHGHGR